MTMKKNLTKRLGLALAGLALALSGSIGLAQTTNILYTYNTTNTVLYTAESYVTNGDLTITTNYTDNTRWTYWYGSAPVVFNWSTNDAATNPASGSLQLDFPLFTGGQEYIWGPYSGLNGNNSVGVNLDNYQTWEFDILVDPVINGLNAAGNFGNFQCIANINWGQVVIGSYVVPAAAATNWQHVSLPIAKGLGTSWGPGFGVQDWNPNGTAPSAATTYYIDNLRFVPAPPAPFIATQPADQELYAGRTINWSVLVTGGQPISYQWYKGSTHLTNGPTGSGSTITGSQTNVLSLANVSAADIAGYSVIATNSSGSITSRVASVAIVSPAGAYAQAVAASGPWAFYELNETSNPTNLPSAFDHVGGFAGVYRASVSNAFNGVQGPRYSGFTHDNAAIELTPGVSARIGLPALNLDTNTVTITCWINPRSKPSDAGIVFCRSGSTTAGLDWASTTGLLGYTWNNEQASWGWQGSGANPPLNEWSFIALVVDANAGGAYIYCMNASQGILPPGFNPVAPVNQSFGGETRIGNDQLNGTTRTFDGYIDDVVIYNRALSQTELQNLYFAATGGPVLTLTGLDLSWSLGTLLEATSLTGPWTPVPSATSPYTITPTDPVKFYRLVFP